MSSLSAAAQSRYVNWAGPVASTPWATFKGKKGPYRDVAIFKLWSQAVQAMLKQTLNVECNLRTVVESVWFDDTANGHFDLAIGAIVSTLLDPSDYFNAWYGKDGPQNYSFWDNEEFQALTTRIDREVDGGKRLTLIRQAEAMMEQDPPFLPVAWENWPPASIRAMRASGIVCDRRPATTQPAAPAPTTT